LVLDDGELVEREPVVVAKLLEVDQPSLVAADAAVLARDLDIHPLDKHPVQAPVLGV
jgi:hypothetical protein